MNDNNQTRKVNIAVDNFKNTFDKLKSIDPNLVERAKTKIGIDKTKTDKPELVSVRK